MSPRDSAKRGKKTRPADSRPEPRKKASRKKASRKKASLRKASHKKASLKKASSKKARLVATTPAASVLDASAFPHLIDLVVTYAPFETQLTLRLTCRHIRDLIDEQMPNHMRVLSEHQRVVKVNGQWTRAPFLPHLIRFADCRREYYEFGEPALTLPASTAYDQVGIVLEHRPDEAYTLDTRVIYPIGMRNAEGWSLLVWQRCSKLIINLGETLFTPEWNGPFCVPSVDRTQEGTVELTVVTCVERPDWLRLPPRDLGERRASKLGSLVASQLAQGSRVIVVGSEIWAAGEYTDLFGKDTLTRYTIEKVRRLTSAIPDFPEYQPWPLPVGWSVEGLVQEQLSFATFDEYREMVGDDDVYAIEICA